MSEQIRFHEGYSTRNAAEHFVALLTTQSPGWAQHESRGWSVEISGGHLPESEVWIRAMCEPEHYGGGATLHTYIEDFARWLARWGWAMRRASATHPALFRLVAGQVAPADHTRST